MYGMKQIFGFLFIGISLISTADAYDAVIEWGPCVTLTTSNSTVINWKAENSTTSKISYATEEYNKRTNRYDNSIFKTSEDGLFHVKLDNLKENTTYRYRIETSGDGDSLYNKFRTFPKKGSFKFIVYGDTRSQPPQFTQIERHKLVSDRISKEDDVSFVIHTGDLVNNGDNIRGWNEFFEAGSLMFSNTSIYPVLGNHEKNHTNYYDAFFVSDYYSFDCGNAHFTMLDSNDWADIDNETEWLNDDLSSSDGTWNFITFHHPPYSSDKKHFGGWENIRAYWENIFIKNDIDAVYNGHVHVYERYEKNGIQYLVLGCGGAPLYQLSEEKIPGYKNSLENTLGYARVTVEEDISVFEIIKVAEVSKDNGNVAYLYPKDTVFETFILRKDSMAEQTYLDVTANVNLPTVGVSLNRTELDYKNLVAGRKSEDLSVKVKNIGTEDVNIKVEVLGSDRTSHDFFEKSLYVNEYIYNPDRIISNLSFNGSADVVTWLEAPKDWNDLGRYESKLIFWSEVET